MINARSLDAKKSMPGEVFAFFQFVHGAAVRALGFAGFGNVQVDLGVTVPDVHARQRAGAKHTALVVQVGSQDFNGCFCHLRLW